jgi:glycosyltransferase involved in cell wall biosynthesis
MEDGKETSPSHTQYAIRNTQSSRALRALLITNIPTPYRIPLFNELNTQLAREGIGFKVVFAALGYPRRKWSIDMAQCAFEWEVLNSGRLPSRDPESAVFTYSGLGRILRAESHLLVIVSGFSLASTRIWLRSFFRRTPYLIWSGAIHGKSHVESKLQRWQRRLLVSQARGFIAYGSRAKEYLISLGAEPARISIAINTVDCDYFRREVGRLRAESAVSDGLKRILYVGNLETGKRVDHLLKVAQLLGQSRQDFLVEIVGSGSQEEYLKQLAVELGVDQRVRFFGFLQRPEVACRLAQACCFVFPSVYDVWGLVLVEAMAAGVPCVSSVHAGATSDLVRDGETGFAVDFSDSRRVADLLERLLDRPEETCRMRLSASRFVADEVSLAKSAAGFVEGIQRSVVKN